MKIGNIVRYDRNDLYSHIFGVGIVTGIKQKGYLYNLLYPELFVVFDKDNNYTSLFRERDLHVLSKEEIFLYNLED